MSLAKRKVGLDSFKIVKVIGKGSFGKVRSRSGCFHRSETAGGFTEGGLRGQCSTLFVPVVWTESRDGAMKSNNAWI